jgi:hypothetical protein
LQIVVACAHVEGDRSAAPAELLLYPRYHLDNGSRLARFPLATVPLALDAVGHYILVACAPLDVMVLRVDKEKGYIDLSKRRVSPEDLKACDEKFNKSKMVHLIARHAAETTGVDLQELQEKVTWPLYKQYGHAFEAFKQVCADPSAIFSKLTNADGSPIDILTPDVVDALVKNIRRRMTPQVCTPPSLFFATPFVYLFFLLRNSITVIHVLWGCCVTLPLSSHTLRAYHSFPSLHVRPAHLHLHTLSTALFLFNPHFTLRQNPFTWEDAAPALPPSLSPRMSVLLQYF